MSRAEPELVRLEARLVRIELDEPANLGSSSARQKLELSSARQAWLTKGSFRLVRSSFKARYRLVKGSFYYICFFSKIIIKGF